MTETDALRIFKLRAGCTAEQVRQTYLDLVKIWHPDRLQSDGRLSARAERELQEINEAYTLLQAVLAGTYSPSPSAATSASRRTYDSTASSTPTPAHAQTAASQTSLGRTVATGIGLGLVIAAAATIVVLMMGGGDDVSRRPPTTEAAPATDHASNPTVTAQRAPAARHERPESGTELLSAQRSGGGSLVVDNASGRDAVVALTAQRGNERAVYVRAGEQVTLANVATGTYQVQMMMGHDWAADRFTRDVAYQELDQPVRFVENNDGNAAEYTRLTVSLQPIVAGMRGIHRAPPFRISSQEQLR